MPKSSDPTTLLLNAEQIGATSSPQRAELIAALQTLGPSSVSELAEYLGSSPKALYYHLKALIGVGLVEVKETRPSSRREESVFGVTADRFIVDAKAMGKAVREDLTRSAKSTLRMTEREHLRYMQGLDAHPELEGLATIYRATIRATPETMIALRGKLQETLEWLRQQEPDHGGVRMSITAFVLPLVPKGRE